MRFRSMTFFAVLTLTAAQFAVAQAIPFAGQLQMNGGPAITFADNTLSCTGLSPGDSVTLAGFMIDPKGGSQAITTPSIAQTADANGVFTATIDGGIKPRSIWLLIDQTAGSYTVAEPSGSVLTQMPESSVSITGDVATINRAHTHVIWISQTSNVLDSRRRGNVSAQSLRATDTLPPGFTVFDAKDGAGFDSDGTINGVVHLSVPSFLDPSQTSACLFVVDDRTLEFAVVYLQFNTNNPPCRQSCS